MCLCMCTLAQVEIARREGIKPIVDILAQGSTRAQQHAAYALSSLASQNVENQRQITTHLVRAHPPYLCPHPQSRPHPQPQPRSPPHLLHPRPCPRSHRSASSQRVPTPQRRRRVLPSGASSMTTHPLRWLPSRCEPSGRAPTPTLALIPCPPPPPRRRSQQPAQCPI